MASNIVAVNDLNAETVVKLLEDGAAGVTLSLPQQKPEDIAARIAARDFSAQTADELFGGNEAESSKEWIGRPFHLVDVAPRFVVTVMRNPVLSGRGVTTTVFQFLGADPIWDKAAAVSSLNRARSLGIHDGAFSRAARRVSTSCFVATPACARSVACRGAAPFGG